ncbi:MAG: hypothetical protein KAY08_04390 [Giesbergeria sp.]|nr:hypothetical protein [Giesbergeria sp.]
MPLQRGCKTAPETRFMVKSASSAGGACASSYHFCYSSAPLAGFLQGRASAPACAQALARRSSGAVRKSAPESCFSPFLLFIYTHTEREPPMDAEHINQIGNTLIDLSERTQELRGYL